LIIGKIFPEVDGKHGCLVALFADDCVKGFHCPSGVAGSTERISQVYKLVSGTEALYTEALYNISSTI